MGMLIEVVLELGGCALGGIVEGIAGLLWPSDDARVRRWQRICLAMLLAGLAAAIGAGVLIYAAPSWHVLTLIAAAGVCFIASGLVGNRIERLCKARQEHDS